ncbi:MAG: hypothetical protein DDT26_00192 [Dehalococcoidia bacterium]|nr:hypothetical protein [Chloroflexota bacterium]
MRIYISGPMTGLHDLNFPAFRDAAAKLRAIGYEVVNPAELNPEHLGCNARTERTFRMNKPTKTDAVLIRLTPEQKAAYQAQGGAKWVRAMIDALIRVGVKK